MAVVVRCEAVLAGLAGSPMTNWNRKLSRVVRTREEIELRTLKEAGDYATNPETMPLYYQSRNEWQHAARLMLEAANGGDIEAATEAIENALFLTARLYFKPSAPRSKPLAVLKRR